MSSDPDEHKWLHRILGVLGVFILLNYFYGTGTLEGLLHVPWDQASTWMFLVAGLAVSAFLVEVYYRKRRGDGQQWIIELYGIIGGLFVLDAVIEDFLTPLTAPVIDPVLQDLGVWGLILLVAFVFGGGWFFILRRLWNGYRDSEGTAQ